MTPVSLLIHGVVGVFLASDLPAVLDTGGSVGRQHRRKTSGVFATFGQPDKPAPGKRYRLLDLVSFGVLALDEPENDVGMPLDPWQNREEGDVQRIRRDESSGHRRPPDATVFADQRR